MNRNDLAQRNPETTALLHQRLKEYLKAVNAGMPLSNPDFDPTATAQIGGRAGRRGAGRGPGQAQIVERRRELQVLEDALKQDDIEKIGQLLADMRRSMESAPARSRGSRPGSANTDSPREQRQIELQQLEEAQKNADKERLGELVAEIRRRIENAPARPSGRRAGRRGAGRRGSGQTEPGGDAGRNRSDNG